MVIPSLTPFCSLFQANAWPKQNGRTNRYQWFNIYPPTPHITHYNGLTIHFPRVFSVPPRCKIHRALNLLQLICCSALSGNSKKKMMNYIEIPPSIDFTCFFLEMRTCMHEC